MQYYLDETMRIFILRQMKSIESVVMKEYSTSSVQYSDAKERRAIIDERITAIFENAKNREKRKNANSS